MSDSADQQPDFGPNQADGESASESSAAATNGQAREHLGDDGGATPHRRWVHDQSGDRIVETIADIPPAPGVSASLERTLRLSPQDSVAAAEQRLRALYLALEELEALAPPIENATTRGLHAELAHAELERIHAQGHAEAAQRRLHQARARRTEFERRAGATAQRSRPWPERTLVALLAGADAALAYIGLTIAAPKLEGHISDPLLWLIAGHGAAIVALAIGCASAATSVRVAQELARAHRGVLSDPASLRSQPAPAGEGGSL